MRVTFARVCRSEWTKLFSLRSTWIVLAGTTVVTVALAGVIGWAANRDAATGQSTAEAVGRAYLGIDLFSLVLGVFGVVLVTGEYSSGLIRATLVAVPRRLPVLAAKALALAAAALPLLLAVCVASLLVGQGFVEADQRVGLDAPDVLRATAGAAAAPVAFALIGLGIGAMLRHTAGAITVYVATMLILPALLPSALPGSVRDDITPYVPVAAGQAMYAVGGQNPFPILDPGPAALVVLGWVVLALAGGTVVLWRRDA